MTTRKLIKLLQDIEQKHGVLPARIDSTTGGEKPKVIHRLKAITTKKTFHTSPGLHICFTSDLIPSNDIPTL